MAIYFGIDSNYANTLFSSLNTSSSGSGIYSLFSEYSSIKSGSYKKLLSAYYEKTGTTSSSTSKTDTKSISTSKDDTKTLTSMNNTADTLKDAATALSTSGSKSVFTKKTVENEDGTKTQEYDTDNIYKSVKAFVDGYNNLIDAGSNSSTSSMKK